MKHEIAPKETEIQATWDDARLYCFSLNIDGKTGWRLPTKEELNEIYQTKNDFEISWYWASTEFDTGSAWTYTFTNGLRYEDYKDNYNHVRAIRDLKDD